MEPIVKRYKLVSDIIIDIQQHKLILPHALLSAIYLYYDGWNSIQNEDWKVIIPYDN
jgi:hypothetical protein